MRTYQERMLTEQLEHKVLEPRSVEDWGHHPHCTICSRQKRPASLHVGQMENAAPALPRRG